MKTLESTNIFYKMDLNNEVTYNLKNKYNTLKKNYISIIISLTIKLILKLVNFVEQNKRIIIFRKNI
jgi:hypothetical protein